MAFLFNSQACGLSATTTKMRGFPWWCFSVVFVLFCFSFSFGLEGNREKKTAFQALSPPSFTNATLPWHCSIFCFDMESKERKILFFLNKKSYVFSGFISLIFDCCEYWRCTPVVHNRTSCRTGGGTCREELRFILTQTPMEEEGRERCACAVTAWLSSSFLCLYHSFLPHASLWGCACFRLCGWQTEECCSIMLPRGGDVFLAWILDSGQGDAFSEQICSGSCISQFAVSFIAFSAYGCLRCSSFDLHLHTFKSSHIPVFLKLVLAIVPNHFCSALTPMLAISSKDLAAQGNCRCVLETVCGSKRMLKLQLVGHRWGPEVRVTSSQIKE